SQWNPCGHPDQHTVALTLDQPHLVVHGKEFNPSSSLTHDSVIAGPSIMSPNLECSGMTELWFLEHVAIHRSRGPDDDCGILPRSSCETLVAAAALSWLEPKRCHATALQIWSAPA